MAVSRTFHKVGVMAWIYVIESNDLPVGETAVVRHEDREIAVFHLKGGCFAIDNFCPHRGAQLHEGSVIDQSVVCPWHQWQFDLTTGKCLNIPAAGVATYPVKIEEGKIWVLFS